MSVDFTATDGKVMVIAAQSGSIGATLGSSIGASLWILLVTRYKTSEKENSKK